MKFKGDIIITDPCYIIRKDKSNHWEKCRYSDNMELLGIKTYLSKSTIYGDWSCTTYNVENEEVIGEFCADAGLVGVFLLEEVLKYNPYFDYHLARTWTTTLIKDFDGEVEIRYNEDIEEIEVVGKGNVNFYTRQTGF